MHRYIKPVTGMALSLSLILGGLAAQTQNIVYSDGDSSPLSGSRNAFPFGSVGIRYQAIFPHSIFGNAQLNIVTIRDILVAGSNTNLEAIYDDIEIKMGITRQTTLSGSWSTNNPNPTTVFRGKLRVRFTGSPASVWGGIGLPKPYFYLPLSSSDNLCVEVIVWAASSHTGNFYFPRANTALQRAFLYGWTGNQTANASVGGSGCRMAFVLNDGNIAFAGTGCQSSRSTALSISANPAWPQLGNPLTLSLTGAFGPSPAFLVLGPALNPVDMAVFGAPGCVLWNDILISVPTITNSSGAASFKVTVPQSISPGTVYSHWLVFDNQANLARLTTSDYATIIIGQ